MKSWFTILTVSLSCWAVACTSDTEKICDKATQVGSPMAGPSCEAAVEAMKECGGWDDGIVSCVEGAAELGVFDQCMAMALCSI